MHTQMSTSVLIVNFRGYDDLERCLQSLEPQLRPDDEVIVVDNEGNEARAVSIASAFPYVSTLPSAVNLGFAAGINLAARRARNPFLLVLNPDTVVEGPLVAVLEEFLCSNQDTAVVGPRVLNGDGSIQPSARAFPGFSTLLGGRSAWLTRRYPGNPWARRNLLGLDALEPLRADWLSGSCLMTRRDVFERLGGFDESFFLYWEDADYCRRVAGLGLYRMYVPAVSVRHIGGGSARYNLARAIREFHRSAYLLYCKQKGLEGTGRAPLVRAGLYIRGVLRVRRALAAGGQVEVPSPDYDPALACRSRESHLDSVAT
jgi:N-acetylglucosaminyl-diphospho-decaprenol L-rhamnosyltransferase